MGHLHTSLLLLLLFCSLSVEKSFWTYLGTRCIEDCKISWGKYTCKTIDKDGKCQEMYCSPQEDVDYLGRPCDSDQCLLHGKDYYWCSVGWLKWGYCGPVMAFMDHYGSEKYALCYDYCEKRGWSYNWCNTAEGSDYCSPSANVDYKNKECKEDSPCGKHGYDYYWCNLKEGGWGKCGLVEPKLFIHRSMYHYVCLDECQYHESGDYYWCHTAKDWDYCSPEVDVTYKGKPCRSDHSCALHEKGYNWCWTSDSEYDYCGPIEPGDCTYVTPRRSSRVPEGRVMICTEIDKGNKKITTFNAEPDSDNIADGRSWRNEAQRLISRWDNGYLLDQSRSNRIRSENLRIDIQGTRNDNNQLYYNLQIQLNTIRLNRESTTVSQVMVPRDVPSRYIRRAFLESLRRRAKVSIVVESQNQC